MSADLSTSQTCYILQESGTAGSYILHHISQILHPTGQVLNSSGPRTIDVLLESNMLYGPIRAGRHCTGHP